MHSALNVVMIQVCKTVNFGIEGILQDFMWKKKKSVAGAL